MWFKKKKNKQELSFEQASEVFSELLVRSSDRCLTELKNQLSDDNEKKVEFDEIKDLTIKKLFLFFFIHFIDRRAFSILTPENRKALMDPIGYRTISEFIKSNVNHDDQIDQDNLTRQHLEELNSFVLKFNKYKKIIPLKDESQKDTLFWEFSKEISQAIDNSVDIKYVIIANQLATLVITNLKIDDIVEEFK